MEIRLVEIGAVFTFFIALSAALPNIRPPYIDCVNSDECGKFECCVMGMGRFSIPTCKPMREVGEGCSPYTEPRSTNVSYPDNSSVALKNIYFNICPCSPSLRCDTQQGTCFDPTLSESFNFLEDY